MRIEICDSCGWVKNNKELKKISPTSEVWECPKCGGIFFVYKQIDKIDKLTTYPIVNSNSNESITKGVKNYEK